LGIDALAIHGGITQDKRSKTLSMFHSKKVSVLIATDVAARGLHIEGVSHVYNYDAPSDPKEYIHRIGRTARAGEEGKVINLISMRDYENFNNLHPKDLGIKQEETPFVEPVRIRWIPGRGKDYGGPKRFGIRDTNRYQNREREHRNRDASRESSRGRSHSSIRGGEYRPSRESYRGGSRDGFRGGRPSGSRGGDKSGSPHGGFSRDSKLSYGSRDRNDGGSSGRSFSRDSKPSYSRGRDDNKRESKDNKTNFRRERPDRHRPDKNNGDKDQKA